jgi:hypothetical protein
MQSMSELQNQFAISLASEAVEVLEDHLQAILLFRDPFLLGSR